MIVKTNWDKWTKTKMFSHLINIKKINNEKLQTIFWAIKLQY